MEKGESEIEEIYYERERKKHLIQKKMNKQSLKRILSFKPKLLNKFISFYSIDDLIEMFQLNQETTKILQKTKLSKSFFDVRKEFSFPIKSKPLNNKEEENKNNEKRLSKKIELTEKKILNFNKYNLSKLLNNNCEIIRKISSKLKLEKEIKISIFGKIIEKQIRKEKKDEIIISKYNLDEDGIAMLNYALFGIGDFTKIHISDNLPIKHFNLINNIIYNRSELQILNLSHNNLGDNNIISIFNILQNESPNLKIINFSGNQITKKTFMNEKVKKAFSNGGFTMLRKFIINNNIIGTEGVEFLFENLLNCHFLSLLDISYNGIEENCFSKDKAKLFFDPMNSGLYYFYTFYYEGNYLPSSETNNLILCILSNPLLNYLYLGNNQLDDDSIQMLSYLLKENSHIRFLHIDNNNFTIKGINYLCKVIEDGVPLIELNLSKNKIDVKSLKKLLDSLKKNKHIWSLNLSYNNFSKGTKFIIDFIETNTTIKNLNLSSCSLGLGIKQLLSVLVDNKKIASLNLSYNGIGGNKEIFEKICNFLKNNYYIKNFHLDGNYINDKDFEKLICDGLQYNINLNYLSLENNIISLENFKEKNPTNIFECLKLNNHIREIPLTDNPIKNINNLNIIQNILQKNGSRENLEYILNKYD